MPVAVIVVPVASGSRLRREGTQLIFSGFENESENTCNEHECHRQYGNFHCG